GPGGGKGVGVEGGAGARRDGGRAESVSEKVLHKGRDETRNEQRKCCGRETGLYIPWRCFLISSISLYLNAWFLFFSFPFSSLIAITIGCSIFGNRGYIPPLMKGQPR